MINMDTKNNMRNINIFNLSGAETWIFRENCVNTMAAEALAPFGGRP